MSLAGGHEWHMDPLATVRSPNITPDATGIAEYSDGELARVIRHGVKRDDTGALFMMAVGPMSDDDLVAVMSYLRTVACRAARRRRRRDRPELHQHDRRGSRVDLDVPAEFAAGR